MKWIENKRVVLTGASSGIGKEITKILIEKYNCFVIGIGRNEQRMIDLKISLNEKSQSFSYCLFDISNIENWNEFVDNLENKNVDILINCAGMLPKFDRFENYSIELLDEVIKIGVKNYQSNNKKIHSFESNILAGYKNGAKGAKGFKGSKF